MFRKIIYQDREIVLKDPPMECWANLMKSVLAGKMNDEETDDLDFIDCQEIEPNAKQSV